MKTPVNARRAHPPAAVFSRWQAPDGFSHRRMDWPQPAGAAVRGSLLFAGGRGDFIEKYLEALGHWHDAGWNLIVFDWRGQGGSQAPGAKAAGFDVLVDDLAALLESWRGAQAGPHVAIGHSMGGHVLLRTLIEREAALDAAVLIAPMILVNSAPIPGWMAPDLADWMCRLGLSGQPMWKTPPALARPGSQRQSILTGSRERYEDELWWWQREPGFNLGAPTWGWMRDAYRSAAAAFTAERLGKVDLPVLLLGSGRDRLVSDAAIRRVAAQLPRAEIEIYPGAGHEILREEDAVRQAALARIDAFLDRNAP